MHKASRHGTANGVSDHPRSFYFYSGGLTKYGFTHSLFRQFKFGYLSEFTFITLGLVMQSLENELFAYFGLVEIVDPNYDLTSEDLVKFKFFIISCVKNRNSTTKKVSVKQLCA